MGYILATIRAILIIVSLCAYLLVFLIEGQITGNPEKVMKRLKKSWCRLVLYIGGIKLHIIDENEGEIEVDDFTYLAMSNHRSFLDPVLAVSYLDVRPLSKAEVADYPIIGYAARKAEVVFVQRENKGSRKAAFNAIKQYLLDGKSVLVYPEGTTSDAATTLEFRKGSFHAAAESKCAVLPLTLHYREKDAIWVNRSLIGQYYQHFKHWHTEAYLKVGRLRHISSDVSDIQAIRAEINENIRTFAQAKHKKNSGRDKK